MSWSTSNASPISKGDINSDTIPTPYFSDDETVKPVQEAQYEAALEAASALAAQVGPPDALVHVSLSGHANPDHGPREGWSNETLTVQVSNVNA